MKTISKTILIAGYYGNSNVGDEAILTSILKEIQELAPEATFCIVSNNPQYTKNRYRFKVVDSNNLAGIIEAAQKCDLIILGGGGVYHDYWGAETNTVLTQNHAGIPFYSSFPLIANLLEKPIMIYSVGVGPLFSANGKKLTRVSFDYANMATVRDKESLALLKTLGVKTEKIKVTADPAFNLPADEQNAKMVLRNANVLQKTPRVGICMRNWDEGVEPAQWQEQIAAALDKFVESNHCALLFIPFQDLKTYPATNDVTAAEKVIARMNAKGATKVFRRVYSPEVTAGLLAQCDMVVGMRMHSLVFAATAGIPFVGLIYDPKVSSLLKQLGLEQYGLDLDSLNHQKLLKTMKHAWNNREQIRNRLRVKVQRLKKRSEQNARLAIGLLNIPRDIPTRQPGRTDFIKEFALTQTSLLIEAERNIQKLTVQLDDKEQARRLLACEVAELDIQLAKSNIQLAKLNTQLAEKKLEAEALTDQIKGITGSTAWKVILFLWRARLWLIPHGSRRERIIQAVLHRFPLRIILTPPYPFSDQYVESDNSQVTLFTDNPSLFPDYLPRKSLNKGITNRRLIEVSLVASVKNENKNVLEWIQSILAQTRLPDEIVIVDGGSTDETRETLEALSKGSSIPLFIISAPGTNIAQARNIAIDKTHFPVIAITDFGCQPEPTWLENLIKPFEEESDLKVSAGFYDPVNRKKQSLAKSGIWLKVAQIDPQKFLPSSRSIAFSKEAWKAIGGYPEWLTNTGEDTFLDLELKRLGGKWAFVPDAIVKWNAPDNLRSYLTKMYKWAIGDGEAGLHTRYYWGYVLRFFPWLVGFILTIALSTAIIMLPVSPIVLWLGLIVIAWLGGLIFSARGYGISLPLVFVKAFGEVAQLAGFLTGARRQKIIRNRRLESVKGVYFILSGVPIDDTGGGARGTQITLELLQRGYAVIYINKFPKYESKELHLGIAHPNLLTYSVSDFTFDSLAISHKYLFENKSIAAIVEHPIRDFLPIIEKIREHNGVIAYDLIDDWNTTLGAPWYSPQVEEKIISDSHILTATAPLLKECLTRLSKRNVTLLPNAVDHRLFNPDKNYRRPADLPQGEWTIIYIGALWGEWFDWNLLKQIAIQYPDVNVVVIGDYKGQCLNPPRNIYFLGLKPQKDLPAYLSYAGVAIIPWKINKITQATSPLKIFEYLAMRRPVVAPAMKPLQGIPGVFQARNEADFLALLEKARYAHLDKKTLSDFSAENNWQVRVGKMISLIQQAQA